MGFLSSFPSIASSVLRFKLSKRSRLLPGGLVDQREAASSTGVSAQTWSLEGSWVTEQPASALPSLGDKWPQHGLFISCLEKWTVPPCSASPPPLHMSANVIILSFVRSSGGFGIRVCVCLSECMCADANSGEFGGHMLDKLLTYQMPCSAHLHSIPHLVLL